MKLYDVNVDKLFKTVSKCSGRVELVCGQDTYDLKSKLSQIAAIAKEFTKGTAKEIELRFQKPEDCQRFFKLAING